MSKPKNNKILSVPTEALKELLTPSELRMISNRWQIINLLKTGLSIRQVAQKIKVGTDTVVRVSRMKQKEGLKKLIDEPEPPPSKTSWIFGKGE